MLIIVFIVFGIIHGDNSPFNKLKHAIYKNGKFIKTECMITKIVDTDYNKFNWYLYDINEAVNITTNQSKIYIIKEMDYVDNLPKQIPCYCDNDTIIFKLININIIKFTCILYVFSIVLMILNFLAILIFPCIYDNVCEEPTRRNIPPDNLELQVSAA